MDMKKLPEVYSRNYPVLGRKVTWEEFSVQDGG
jgi:hypothetical protein